MSPAEEAVKAYELALVRAEQARDEWKREGEPFTIEHPNGTKGKHPMWLALLDAEAFLLRSRAVLRAQDRRGRPPGTSSAPDRKPTKLRAVS